MSFRIPGVTDTELDPKVYGPNSAKSDNIRSSYSVDQLSYPEDLFAEGEANRYGNNYVIFFINVAEDSRLLSKNVPLGIVDDVPPRLRGGLIGEQFNIRTLGTGLAGIIGTVATVSGIGTLAGGASVLGSLGKIGLGGATVSQSDDLGSGLASLIPLDLQRQQKRLKKAIALHVPNNLNIRYSTQWQDVDTFLASAIGSAGSDVGKVFDAISKGETSGAWDNTTATGRNLGAIAGNIALSNTGQLGDAVQVATGIAPNPKKEQMFKNVNFREFTFEYTFSPRSKTEARAVQQIIQEFKLHMHPEFKDDGGFLYIYPSEFDIAYYHNGIENPTLHKHTSCVLRDMQINYTPNGAYNTFDGGMSTQINVSLSFLEIAILTKKEIEEGY